jgi:hypothetical protein
VTTLLAFVNLTFDPGIRGILIVTVAMAILCGSVYLLLATNTGIRLGFLLAATGFMSWMFLMGLVWWIYAIGLTGNPAEWRVTEVVRSDAAEDTSAAALPEARDLGDDEWEQLDAADPARGEAQAEADEAIAGDGRVAVFEAPGDYLVLDVFQRGGVDPGNPLHRIPGPRPTQHAVVQVQGVIEVEVPFGEAPPPAEADPSEPVYSVVMVRDLGNERLPPAIVTISSLILLALLANALHRRDKIASENRAKALAEAS